MEVFEISWNLSKQSMSSTSHPFRLFTLKEACTNCFTAYRDERTAFDVVVRKHLDSLDLDNELLRSSKSSRPFQELMHKSAEEFLKEEFPELDDVDIYSDFMQEHIHQEVIHAVDRRIYKRDKNTPSIEDF